MTRLGPMAKELGAVIQRFRIARDLTHREVGDRTGASGNDVACWERGVLVPEPRQWARLTNMVARGLKAYREVYERARAEMPPPTTPGFDGVARRDDVDVDAAYAKLGPTPPEAAAAIEADPPALPVDAATLGEALRRARVLSGLHQRELGELMGVDQSTVSSWERNITTPITDHIAKLIDLYPDLERWRDVGRNIDKPDGGPGRPPGQPIEDATRRLQPKLTALVARGLALPPAPDPAPPTLAELGAAYAQALLDNAKALNALDAATAHAKATKTALEAAHEALQAHIDSASSS